MNTKYLLTLKAILETGSFQKAADSLNYTPVHSHLSDEAA